jgi:hypothetical protein
MSKTVKVKLGLYVSDGGDGSVYAHIVKDEDTAQRFVDRELNEHGQAYSDGGASETEIEVDVETGEIINGMDLEEDIFVEYDDEEEEEDG